MASDTLAGEVAVARDFATSGGVAKIIILFFQEEGEIH